MSQSLNSKPSYRANLPKEGHNLSHQYYFTSSSGMILPVFHHPMNQGEKMYFNLNETINVGIPLVKPANLRVHTKVDVFFVPLQMLSTAFGQSFYGTNDYLSSEVKSNEDGRFPLLKWNEIIGNHFPYIENFEKPFNFDYDEEQLQSNENPKYLRFDCCGKSAFRLLMHLNYNPFTLFKNIIVDKNLQNIVDYDYSEKNVFPYALLAYQAIYQNYYRDDDREPRNIRSYQFDYVNNNVNVDGVPLAAVTMKYHQRFKDYFTSIHVSPIMSTLNLNDTFRGDLLSKVNNYLGENNIQRAKPDSMPPSPYDIVGAKDFTQFANYDTHDHTFLTTANIRSLFAVEKLNRILGRARKDYDSQTLAHLGFKVPRDIKHEISYLGGYEGGIGVKQHFSQSNTFNPSTGTGSELGEQFGTAQGGISGDHRIEFTAPCHGVFMAVQYTIPEVSYSQGYHLDKVNMVTNRLDLYQPEFDKLGQQPLFAYEANNRRLLLDPNASRQPIGHLPLGWQYRYEQYKRKYNRHSLAFYNPISDSENVSVNTWSPWIVGQQSYDFYFLSSNNNVPVSLTPTYESFLVSPSYLDDLFVNKYNPYIGLYGTVDDFDQEEVDAFLDVVKHPWLMFQTDPFMHAVSISAALVSTMSKFGEPELI